MNKHTYTAICSSIITIISSFLFWTSQISNVQLPVISNSIVSQFTAMLKTVLGAGESAEEIPVQEHLVEDLGEHFVQRVQKNQHTASVLQQEYTFEQQPPAVPKAAPASVPMPKQEVAAGQDEGSVSLPEEPKAQEKPQHAAAPDELKQWDLRPTWTIAIPSLGIRAPVLLPSMKNWTSRAWSVLEEQMQVGLNHGVVAYPNSVAPGNVGNLVLAGHSSPPTESAEKSSYGSIFAKLPDIAVGEEVRVASVRYAVEEKFVVSPQETSILEQQYDESVLKLITCYPVGTTKDRMIILARKVEE